VVHSWRGPDGVEDATKRGFACLRSHGYYIDLNLSAGEHYLNDPVPAERGLTSEQGKRILGGEATMWSEWVTPETIDSRIWPRTAAIAERFWSPREVRDGQDMYRRLNLVSRRLEEVGLHHMSYLDPALRRLAGDGATATDLVAWRTIVDLLEPVKYYRRNELQAKVDLRTPLTGLADCARPDSEAARVFASRVDAVVDHETSRVSDAAAGTQQLSDWKAAAAGLVARLRMQSPRFQAAMPVLQAVISAGEVGLEAMRVLAAKGAHGPSWREARIATLGRASLPHAAAELAIIAPLKRLVDAAAGPHQSSAGHQPGSTTQRRDTPFGSSS
jgi:hexosaminidase